MTRFRPLATPIPGLIELCLSPLGDHRGEFERLFCADELRVHGHPGVVAQANRSLTFHPGTVRGMHFQRAPHADWKLITCLRGRVLDVIVDLRRGSATLLAWHAVELGEGAHRSLLVPPGCGHGFQVLDGPAEMLYVHSEPYVPGADDGVRADDPRIGIRWPMPIQGLSGRDAAHPPLPPDFTGITL